MGNERENLGAWRVSSVGKKNLDLAIAHGTWGASRNYVVGHIRVGDRLVLYVSQPPGQGYWGFGVVTRELFMSRAPIWPTWSFPYRFCFQLDGPLLQDPVSRESLFERLPRRGNKRFEFGQPSGVMKLTPDELVLIEALVEENRGAR
jgi:hypothetical protein